MIVRHCTLFLTCLFCFHFTRLAAQDLPVDSLCGHRVLLDNESKIIPWTTPGINGYDHFLKLRWNFILHKVPFSPGPPPRSSFPQYYFYCAFRDSANQLLPDQWMNDVGEKIPMWFESARLYYSYSGDRRPLDIVKGMVDYSLAHGITPGTYSWSNFPQTAANAGALDFRGFTTAHRFSPDDVQVDHAGDIGATYFKMFLFYGQLKYRDAAIHIARMLARKIKAGDAVHSPWPYVVNMKTGKTVSEYGTNWFGCIRLLQLLIDAKTGTITDWQNTLNTVKAWLLNYPFKNNIWVDGHTDTYITGTGNLSNLSASNAGLYISDNTGFDPQATRLIPGLIKWTEENFVARCAPGEPSNFRGANLVSEQVAFMPKMDYQTARYAAQCARWYALSGDTSYKEKAYRSINFVTYCNDTTGKAFESPFSKGVNSWWSDSYGEGPSMFYHVFAGVPEWAPEKEDHILYSTSVLKNVFYAADKIQYTALQPEGIEYLRLSFKPSAILVNGAAILQLPGINKNGYSIRDLGNGDFAVIIQRKIAGNVLIKTSSRTVIK